MGDPDWVAAGARSAGLDGEEGSACAPDASATATANPPPKWMIRLCMGNVSLLVLC